MSMTMLVIVGAIAVVLFMLVSAAVKIVQEYERGVIFRLGRMLSSTFGSWTRAKQTATWQRRYLQTLIEIAAEKNSTIVFPLPIDLIQMLLEGRSSGNGTDDATQNRKVSWPPAAAV